MEATVPIQDITFCIKTIHRPWACHRLVQSLRKELHEPKIVVVDDGLPEHWFSRKYPETAKHCKVIDLKQHDVGVGIGRNTAIDAAETEFIFLLDDDQIVTPDLHLDRVYQRFIEYELTTWSAHRRDLMISLVSSNQVGWIYWQRLASNRIERMQMERHDCSLPQVECSISHAVNTGALVTLPSVHSFVIAS